LRRIELIMRSRSMKGRDLSRASGLSAPLISGILTGYIGRPYDRQIVALCAALSWPVDEADELLEEVPPLEAAAFNMLGGEYRGR